MQKVFLIGDSIRMGYDRYVRDHLSGRAEVYYPSDNCRFAAYTLRHCMEWIEKDVNPEELAVIHFNCGLWDNGRYDEDEPFTPLEVYLDYLRRIVRRLRKRCPNAALIFATSTPVQEERYDRSRFMRRNEDIRSYNEAACRLMAELGVAVDDLYAAAAPLPEDCWSDGTHLYTPLGTKTLGDAVVNSIASVLK